MPTGMGRREPRAPSNDDAPCETVTASERRFAGGEFGYGTQDIISSDPCPGLRPLHQARRYRVARSVKTEQSSVSPPIGSSERANEMDWFSQTTST